MSTDLDAVIKEVAQKNGIGLRKDDPIMSLVTIMNRIIDDQKEGLTEQQKRLLVNFAEKLEESLQRVSGEVKGTTEKSLNAVVDYAKNLFPKIMASGANEVVQLSKGEMAKVMFGFNCELTSFKSWLRMCLIVMTINSAVVTAVAILIVLYFVVV